jgi:hypothetical protein
MDLVHDLTHMFKFLLPLSCCRKARQQLETFIEINGPAQ